MITSERSRTGHEILRIENRLLASSIDPLKEAAQWAKRAGEGLVPYESVVIIGLGCGYHAASFIEQKPEVPLLILEPNAEVAARALVLNPSLSSFDVVVETDLMNLTRNGRVRDALGGHYRIVPHGPTCQVHPQWATQMIAFLLGRDKASFLLQLRMRPELFALLDPRAIESLASDAAASTAPANEPVSIKSLQKLFATESSGSHERRLWRCLEELVL